jgi:hypothetical protein
MKKTAIKLGISISAMPLSLVLVGLTGNGFFMVPFFICIPLTVLYWIDLGRELRNTRNSTRVTRALGIVMGVPQALFGLACAAVGLAIIVWVIYNTFVERQPEYSGGFMTLGIGPTLILFGVGWLVNAFHRDSDGSDES